MVDIDKLKIALSWLMTNNILFRDVRLHFRIAIDILESIQVTGELSKYEKKKLGNNENN